MKWLTESWYKPQPFRWLLAPLSLLFRLIVAIRKQSYSLGIFKQNHLAVPVIVVGNITVGGTGKTPFVIWLAKQLQQQGYKPGIISRGYGGKSDTYPIVVDNDSDPTVVGDEPVIIARQTACPMAVSPKRTEAASYLLKHYDCDLIISDDGLQHYALARDLEIVIVDAQREFGNQFCLPAGPLREPMSRLNTVDFIVYNGGNNPQSFTMTLEAEKAINLADANITKDLTDFKANLVHGVAGIGNPGRFFTLLNSFDINVIPHAFNDHYLFQSDDVDFKDNKSILMTEKDAVKCQHFARDDMWYIPITASVSGDLAQLINQKIAGINAHG